MIKLKDLLKEKITVKSGKYLDTNRYDKRFKDLKKLANWLNKNKFRYVGIDDR